MIFAETPYLRLRALEKSDLPRLAEYIGKWDVARWLTIVPHPYTERDAQEHYDKMLDTYQRNVPEYFVMADKIDNKLMGAVGLHTSRVPEPKAGEIEIGYWLGKPFWGQGFMSEAVKAAIVLAFQRPDVALIASTTDPVNEASNNVLRKAGFKHIGIFPRKEPRLRGPSEITRWELMREK